MQSAAASGSRYRRAARPSSAERGGPGPVLTGEAAPGQLDGGVHALPIDGADGLNGPGRRSGLGGRNGPARLDGLSGLGRLDGLSGLGRPNKPNGPSGLNGPGRLDGPSELAS
jgi:hypothetical protein